MELFVPILKPIILREALANLYLCSQANQPNKQTIKKKKNQRRMAGGKENHPEGGPNDVMEGGCCL